MKNDTKLYILIAVSLCAALFIFLFSVVAPSSAYAAGICKTNGDCNYINGIAEYWTGGASCRGAEVWQNYWRWTCVNPDTAGAYCTSSSTPTKQTTCPNGCSAGTCITDPTGDGSSGGGGSSCTSHSYVKCSNNAIYWFNSCNAQQELYQSCGSGCSANASACNSYVTTNVYNNTTNNTYNYHSTLGCQNNVSYWYDSQGTKQDVYKNCNTTGQTCTNGQCTGPVTTTTTKPKTTTTTTASAACKPTDYLAISIFGQKKSDSKWTKNFKALEGEQVNFLVVVKNMSGTVMDNVSIKLDAANFIPATYNLAIDNVASDKNILTGINLGTMSAGASTIVSFSGTVQPKEHQEIITIASTGNSGKSSNSDSLTVNIDPSNGTLVSNTPSENTMPADNLSDTTTTGSSDIATAGGNSATAAVSQSPIAGFLKKWYIWLIAAIILVFMFIIIFRRLATRTEK